MLVLFFTIIFLAELIVAGWLIAQITKARKFVCEVNEQVTTVQPLIKENIEKAHEILSKTLVSLEAFMKFLAEKQGEFGTLFNRNIFSTAVAIVLKLPFKEILSLLEVIIKVKKILGK
jgi:hypothetical protein